MNFQHIRTLIWLRWRLTLASLRRAGIVTKAILVLLAVGLVLASVGGFVASLSLGIFLLPHARPNHLMLLWDIVAVTFLLFWWIGFLSELQRSEPIAVEKLLHLPLSLRGAFLLNFLSSFVSLTVVCLLPAIVGLCVALPIALGPRMLVVIPLVIGFLLLVTSLTFHIRGWLATLIANPRRRRTVMAIITTVFIVTMQLPNIGHLWIRKAIEKYEDQIETVRDEKLATIDAELQAAEISDSERQRLDSLRTEAVEECDAAKSALERKYWTTARHWVVTAHKFIPFAWLPYGVQQAALGRLWPSLLGSAGMLGLAALSLQRSYRSTLRHYRQAESGPARGTTLVRSRRKITSKNGLAKPFPWAPPIPANIARANWCSLLRAPEVKMQLIGPVLVLGMLLLLVGSERRAIPAALAPLVATGLMLMISVTCANLIWNQFGFDRDAFRCYVLLPISGRDLLLGKNLSVAAMCGPILLLSIALAYFLLPMAFFDLLACFPTCISIFLIMLMVGNFLSTRFPMPIAASAMRKTQFRWQTVLAHLGMTFFVVPILMAFPISAMGVQAACRYFELLPWVPLGLILATLVCAVVSWIYWSLLPAAGRFLAERQPQILLEITRSDR